jgi:hypothetical protein
VPTSKEWSGVLLTGADQTRADGLTWGWNRVIRLSEGRRRVVVQVTNWMVKGYR